MTSHEVCASVKRLFRFRKVGHLGTLDPIATGVLPLCVNEATKLVQFLMFHDKEYRCTMELGVTTDTHDSQGTVIARCEDIPRDPELIRLVLEEFCGELWQLPPMFSALKHSGVPLYKLARTGKTVQRQMRRIRVSEIELVALDIPRVVFRVVCSAGTYVRTLCHDIGQRLGCGAHMADLERVRNGSFHISAAVTLDELMELPPEKALERYLIPMSVALGSLPEITVDEKIEQKLRNGSPVTVGDVRKLCMPYASEERRLKVLSCRGRLIGIVEQIPSSEGDNMPAWKTLRVFAAEGI